MTITANWFNYNHPLPSKVIAERRSATPSHTRTILECVTGRFMTHEPGVHNFKKYLARDTNLPKPPVEIDLQRQC